MNPRQARELCAQPDASSTIDSFRRENIHPAALRQLLRYPQVGTADRSGLSSGVYELTDRRCRRSEVAVHVPVRASRPLGALIVLHGGGGSGEEILPRFRALGEALAMAVVCPTAQLPIDTSHNLDIAGFFGKKFAQPRWNFIGEDFHLAALRWALTRLHVDPNRCALLGFSMGGMATWNLGMGFWPLFCAAVPINGALSMWESFGSDQRTRDLLPNTLPLPLFVVHGGKDRKIPPRWDRESVATLRALGHRDIAYTEVPDGEHDLETLGIEPGTALTDQLATWLSGRRRAQRPRVVRHRAVSDEAGRAHWIRIGGVKHRAVAEVVAIRKSPWQIEISVTGATTVTVYLTSGPVQQGDTIQVSINKVPSNVRFTPDLASVVQSYREIPDPEMTAEHMVSFEVPQVAEE